MPGSFVHLELNTDDTDRATAFYRELFGWNFNEWPMGDSIYWGFSPSEPPGGGVQRKPMPDAPTQWMPYISVEDVHSTVDRARSAGAEIIVDFMPIDGAGELAILRDPTGAAFGLWKSTSNGQSAQSTASAAEASGGTKTRGGKKAGAKKAGKKAGKVGKNAGKKAGKAGKAVRKQREKVPV